MPRRRRWVPPSSVPRIIDDPSKPIDEILFGPRPTPLPSDDTPMDLTPEEPARRSQRQKEPTMTPQPPSEPSTALAPTAAPSALAVVPPGLPFTPEEWGTMTDAEKAGAIAFFREEQAQTTEGLDITFPRVKYPTAGSSFWEVPTPTGDADAVKELEGVVVYKQPVRAYWPLDQEPGKNPPLCSSLDGIVPVEGPGKQAATCGHCPHAQWGTGKDGRGQACKARLNVFLLREGQDIPMLLSLPPTAIRTFSQYAVQLRQARSALVAVTTVFGLTKATSSGGVDYKALTLKIGRKLSYAEMRQAAAIREVFEAQMAKRGIRIEEATDDAAPAGGEVIDGEARTVPY
jgi:hypothetical protein